MYVYGGTMNEITEEILNWVSKSDYEKGLNYDEDFIDYVGFTNIDFNKRYQFLVESESSYRKYMVQIEMKNNQIMRTFCTCPQYQGTKSCKHVAACSILYSDRLFSMENEKVKVNKSQLLLKYLKEGLSSHTYRKEEVYLYPCLAFESSYYHDYVLLKVKIGQSKTYSLLGKLSGFLNAYQDHESFKFGSGFTFDPDKHYLSSQSIKFLDFLDFVKTYFRVNGNSVILNDRLLKQLLDIYPNGIYLEDENHFLHLKNEFPFDIPFSKVQDTYKMSLESLEFVKQLTEDCEYLYKDNNIYHLNADEAFFFQKCLDLDVKEICFSEQQFNDFQKNVLRVVKDKVQLDDTTKDVIIETNPEVRFYFDLNDSSIICTPKFLYRNEEISYFDEVSGLIRDTEYEYSVVSCLIPYGFHQMSHFFLVDDLDLVGDFLEEGLDELAKQFSIFTSEKLQQTNILKNNTITSTFHIGKDHILHYDFDLGNISSEDISKVMSSMAQRKKYYRLKNGDILSLESDNLKELQDLSEGLDLSLKDLENGSGVIPKYRALYLDSLQQHGNKLIRTDSLFQEFIQKFQKFQNCDVSFTDEEKSILRDYQVNGVKWLYTIANCGLGGILADEMGLGKSLQTITFFKKMLELNSQSKFLIVCPTSLVYNWENEFDKFANELSYQVFAGNRNERHVLLENFKGNIYITSYGLLREDLSFYQNHTFQVFVIDEAQNIKNPTAGLTKAVKSINAEVKLALTGTPIENSIVELWSIFDFIMPGFLSSLMKFQQKYRVKEFDDKTNSLLDQLKSQVKPFILRRKKSDVIQDLPEKIENNIYIDLNDEQKKIYAAEVKYVNETMDKMIQDGGFMKNKMLILRLLTRLRQICIDPSILFEDYQGESAKITNLIKIIKEVVGNGHKILLFTSFKTALNIVQRELLKENISSYVIAGDVPSKKRQMLVDAFNKDQTNVFLIMLKSGGTGLNLTSADVVIHLDLWWNPQAENQATDRTHRIGQTKNVEVIKLICKGTIEEKILDLQQKKKILSDKILEHNMDDSAYLQQLTEKDIRDLLAYENKD